MSIIFEKLKSLKGRITRPEQGTPLVQAHNIYSFKKLIFSPQGALLILVTITAFGFVSFLSLSVLKGILDTGSSKAIVINAPPTENDPLMDPSMMDPSMMGDTEGMDSQEDTQDNKNEEPVEEFNIPEFFIQPDMETETQAKTTTRSVEKIRKSIYELLDKDRKKNKEQYTHLSPEKKEIAPQFSRPHLIDQEKPVHPVPDNNMQDNDVQNPAGQMEDHRIHTDDQTTFTPGIFAKPEKVKASFKHNNLPADPELTQQEELEAEQKRQRQTKEKRAKKIAQIANLSTALEDAVRKNDLEQIDQVLKKLSKKTDRNSAYFLKLLAFQKIRKKQYTQAKYLLDKVLSRNDTDLEAGLNMAIIEIRQEQFSKAKKRLVRLREIYPSQETIEQLLSQL